MIIMSVDLGKVRTGLAVCDKNEILTSPAGVINEKNDDMLLDKLAQKTLELKAEKIIIGLPKNMDGSLGESAQRAMRFAKNLQTKTNIPTELWDERRTTITAHERLSQANVRGKKRKSIIDTLSASIILENYLNYRESNS